MRNDCTCPASRCLNPLTCIICSLCVDWAEDFNSVLDDNKMLTLPSGERLGIPPNIRIILEVDSLEYATPATVSRCGMVF
jgi:hypothetical protein